jgi:hypothetical protein
MRVSCQIFVFDWPARISESEIFKEMPRNWNTYYCHEILDFFPDSNLLSCYSTILNYVHEFHLQVQ